MIGWRVTHIEEPELVFGFGQTATHPKDGLFLYGPPRSNQNPARMDVGVVGTADGIALYEAWIRRISGTIAAPEKGRAENKMMWPGFHSVFGIPWPVEPLARCIIDGKELSRRVRSENRHEGIYNAVELYEEALRRFLREEDARPLLWFAIVPEETFKFGRPRSRVPRELRERSNAPVGKKLGEDILKEGWLFEEDVEAAAIYEFELNFHNQLKARLLDTKQVIQVVRETTLIGDQRPVGARRSLQDDSSVAWNLTTTAFYKAGGKPWRLSGVREGVCYVGIVFKLIENPRGRDNACCGAQMFLRSGEGIVFKGAVGPWYSDTDKTFHLARPQAAELMRLVIDAYVDQHGRPPTELFIHGKTWFEPEEWDGFASTVPTETKLVGIRIRRQSEIKLFRYGSNPVLRGTAILTGDRHAYLWTTGYTPRLRTYPGREVPNPITVDIVRGDAEIEVVLADLMSLTKLNYNSANFADGLPVTLRFADLVGEILTAKPDDPDAPDPPLPFMFYI
jgi:hypothetical protein